MKPHSTDKVVMRFKDGRLLKGFIEDFSADSEFITFRQSRKNENLVLNVNELKAIFFVKTFKGDRTYSEKKIFGISRNRGKRIFIKFADKESVVGYTEETIPWRRGFFLSRPDDRKTGFFVFPVDKESNNIKIYVINSAVQDITMVG